MPLTHLSAQGNPIAKYLLAHSSHLYHVRAITRNATKPVSIDLKNLGAEIVEANVSDEASLTAALAGAWAIFAITNFWDQSNFDLEVSQGKLVNRLASQVPELEHYVVSSLPDGRQLAGGKFQNILPYNAKAEIREDLMRYEGLMGKMTEVFVAYYYQNWLKYSAVFGPQKEQGKDGEWVMEMPFDGNVGIPMAWADDVGPVVDGVLKGGEELKGKTVAVVGEVMGHEEMLDVWSKRTCFFSLPEFPTNRRNKC